MSTTRRTAFTGFLRSGNRLSSERVNYECVESADPLYVCTIHAHQDISGEICKVTDSRTFGDVDFDIDGTSETGERVVVKDATVTRCGLGGTWMMVIAPVSVGGECLLQST